jgi:hypothetical protein
MLALRRSIQAFAIVFVFAGGLSAREPFAVLTLRSLDDLLADIRHVTGSKDSSPVDQIIAGVTRGKGLAAIDGSKPLGAYLVPGAEGTPMPDVVIAIPVKDTAAFLGLLGHPSPAGVKIENTVFNIGIFGKNAFGKVVRGYCFLAEKRELVDSVSGAAGLFSSRNDISFVLHFSRLPEELKQLALQQLQATWELQAASLPGMPGSYLRGHEAGRRFVQENTERALREADKAELGLTLDSSSGVITIDWEETARAGTQLASLFSAYGTAVPSFGGMFSSDAALSLICCVPIPAELRDALAAEIASTADQARGQIDTNVLLDTETERKSAHETLDGFLRAFRGLDAIDAGLLIDAAPSGKARFVAACRVGSGSELARALDRFVKIPGAVGEGELKLDVAQHAGARIHALGLPPEVSKVFGKGSAHLALRKDSAFLSVGEDSLKQIQAVLQATTTSGARRLPVSLRARPSRIIDLFSKKGDVKSIQARQAFHGRGDSFAFEVLPIKNGLQGRITFGEGFLNLLKSNIPQQGGNVTPPRASSRPAPR